MNDNDKSFKSIRDHSEAKMPIIIDSCNWKLKNRLNVFENNNRYESKGIFFFKYGVIVEHSRMLALAKDEIISFD